jgi:N-acyl-D-aspartate/D-glutamate deacylase
VAWSLLIRNGRVIDGTGTPAVAGDVAVDGDRIAAVGPVLTGEAGRTIDARGRVIAPGFIDIHSHSDFFYFDCPSAESKLRQGVTTEVVGMCGFSVAPVGPGSRRALLEQMGTTLGARVTPSWVSFGDYLKELRSRPLGVNVVPFVGQGALRLGAMGADDRPATRPEAERMHALLAEAMDAGAFGFSTGLVYPPGSYALTDELVELGRSMAGLGGLYFSHIRGEASTLVEAISEAIEIGERAGVGVQIAHVKAAGRENWSRFDRALASIDAARARGVDVTADVYPYAAGSTIMVNLLPGWALDGGLPALLERLGDPTARGRLKDECMRGSDRWQTPSGVVAWDEVLVANCSDASLAGVTLAEIARREGQDGPDVMLDLLRREAGAVSMVRFNQSEENVAKALAHPFVMVGSDSILLTSGPGPHAGRPHPRTYGTFPRVLGVYARDRSMLTLETAIHKMTGMPAARLGLRHRGTIRPGAFADLTIVDAATVKDEATFTDPHRYPTGIPYVIVNGQVEVDDGAGPVAPAGRVLSRGEGA